MARLPGSEGIAIFGKDRPIAMADITAANRNPFDLYQALAVIRRRCLGLNELEMLRGR
jgi:hypothetical protein